MRRHINPSDDRALPKFVTDIQILKFDNINLIL